MSTVEVDLKTAEIGELPEKELDLLVKNENSDKTLASSKIKLVQPFENIQFTKIDYSVTNGKEQ